VPTFLAAYGLAIVILQRAFLVAALVLALVCLLDWLVRTRRINPFNPIARFFRRAVDPLVAPMERRVVRAGGMPHAAPWWMLVAVVVGGIVILSVLRFIYAQVAGAYGTASLGPRGLVILLLHYTFALLKLAIVVRVVASWIRISPYSRWVRWAFSLSEPILRPLRGVIPPLGMIDVTPIAAYFVLWLLETLVMYALLG